MQTATHPHVLRHGVLALAFFALLPLAGRAQGSGFGLGVILGEPTGLSMKAWIGDGAAIDAAAAWSFEGRGFIHLHLDYLRHANVVQVSRGSLPFYYGIGARVQIREDTRPRFDDDDDVRFGIRIPLGMSYIFANAPLDIFLELAPVVQVVPSTDVDLDGGIGLRYYF